jgi:hypothetical protein
MCIMHKFLGIMINDAHHKGPIKQGTPCHCRHNGREIS